MNGKLTIDGQEVPLSHEYTLRFYHPHGPDAPAEPVLYRHGKRVTRAWKLELKTDQPPDPYGGNANCD